MPNSQDTIAAIYKLVDEYSGELREINGTMGEFDKSAKKQVKSSSLVDKGMKKLAGTIGAVGLAYKGLAFAKDSVALFKEQDKANRLVEVSFGATADQIHRFANELQESAKIGDETTLMYAGMLKNMGLANDQIEELITASADLVAGSGGLINMDTAVKNLSKTYSGITGRITEFVPEIKGLTKEQLEQGKAISIVANKYKGLASEIAKTPVGEITGLTNTIGDLQEEIGEKLLPAQKSWLTVQMSLVTVFRDLSPVISLVVKGISVFAGVVQSIIEGNKVVLGITAISAAIIGLTIGVQAGTISWTAFNAAVAANPLGLATIAAVGLIAAINKLTNASQEARDKSVEFGKSRAEAEQKVIDKLIRITEIENQLKKSKSDKTTLKTLKKQVEALTGETVKFNKETQEAELRTKQFLGAGEQFTTTINSMQRSVRNKTRAEREAVKASEEAELKLKAETEAIKKAEEAKKAQEKAEKEFIKTKKEAAKILGTVEFENFLFGKSLREQEIEQVKKTASERQDVVAKVHGKNSSQVKAIQQNLNNELKTINDKFDQQRTDKLKQQSAIRLGITNQVLAEKERLTLSAEQAEISSIERAGEQRTEELKKQNANNQLIVQSEETTQLQIQEVRDRFRLEEEKKRQESDKKEADEARAKNNQIVGFVQQGANAIFDIMSAVNNKRTRDLDLATSKQIKAVNDSTASEEDKAKKIEQIEKKSADKRYKLELAAWRNNILSAGGNTALAVTKTLASVPFPASIPLAAAAGAAGLVQTGIIASNKPQRMENGGTLRGGSTATDSVSFQGNPGERVIDNRRTRKLNKAIDEGLGGGFTVKVEMPITIEGNATQSVVEKIKESATDIVDRTVRALEIAYEQGKLQSSRFGGAFA